jgi:hypothetical protein
MANQQPELLASPPGDTDLEQPYQVLEELAIQLDFLAARGLALAGAGARFPEFRLSRGGGFLLGDGIADAIYERDEEGQVHGAGYACPVLKVAFREVVDDGFDGLA